MTEDEERALVIEVARSFIGTPYHDNAHVKGPNGAVDCATFLAMVFEEAGLTPAIPIPEYSPQWHLHREDERYMRQVLEYAKEIPEENVKTADVVLYKIGRAFSHGAIIVDWPEEIIHAFKMAGAVISTRAFDFELSTAKHPVDGKKQYKFFTRW